MIFVLENPRKMKINKLAIVLVGLLLLTRCGKEEAPVVEIPKEQEEPKTEEPKEPEIITYLTYNVQSDLDTSERDNYVVVHDQDGTLLGHRSYESGDRLVFQVLDTVLANVENLTVSLVDVIHTEFVKLHTINSYTSIEIGIELYPETTGPDGITSSFDMGKYGKRSGAKYLTTSKDKGNYNLTVNNINGVARYVVTNEFYGFASTDIFPQQVDALQLNNIEMERNEEYFISAEDLDGNYRYLFFEVPETEGDIILDFDDFSEFDSFLEVGPLLEHQNCHLTSKGYSTDQINGVSGLEMSYHADFGDAQTARVGFLDDLVSYETHFSIAIDPNFSYNYSKWGPVRVDNITILDKPTFTVEDLSLSSFRFTTDRDYLYSSTHWLHTEKIGDNPTESTKWHVWAPLDARPEIGELPEEMVALYPELNLDKIVFDKTTLVVKGYDYTGLVGTTFGLVPLEDAREYEAVSLRP